jgi:acyl-CoA oxidase
VLRRQGLPGREPFAALRADSDVFTTFEGDNTVLLQLVAKTLLSDYASQFEDLDAVGMVRTLGTRQVSRWLSETGPLGRFTRDDVALRSADWQAQTLRFREERLVDSLARRLRRLTSGEGMDPLRAMSHCQDHALAAATAHVERIVHEQFAARVATADGEAREVLDRLRDLYALSMVSRDRGWWLEHGYLDNDAAKDLRTEVNVLCGELRPAALGLVAASASRTPCCARPSPWPNSTPPPAPTDPLALPPCVRPGAQRKGVATGRSGAVTFAAYSSRTLRGPSIGTL